MAEIRARRRIWGWLLYDWANSAYATTVAVAVLPVYFAGVVTPPGGWIAGGAAYSATTLWGGAVALAGLLVFLAAPACGAVADHWAMKKRFLMGLCLMGSLSTVLLAFCGPGMVLTTLGLFLVAQIGFVGGNVFYDAFLPHVAGPGQQDRISGQGLRPGICGRRTPVRLEPGAHRRA